MSSYDFNEQNGMGHDPGAEPELIVAELVPEPPAQPPPVARVLRRRVRLPLLLFVATCLSTLLAGTIDPHVGAGWADHLLHGLKYALPVMTILICHEAGHFFQARRYGVYASYPYFIPMPISPIGTLGAVIVMEPRMGHRRALFDIGISGPLAGLVPTLIFCVVGLSLSEPKPMTEFKNGFFLGTPVLFRFMEQWVVGPLGSGQALRLHPMAFAGWVGLLITAINLIPIGQLDGGHILYGLLRTRAHRVATLLLLGAAAAVIYYQLWGWTLMLMLLILMGPVHPPTANDNVPLGAGRILLGWLTLAFIPIGFTPTPFFFIGS